MSYVTRGQSQQLHPYGFTCDSSEPYPTKFFPSLKNYVDHSFVPGDIIRAERFAIYPDGSWTVLQCKYEHRELRNRITGLGITRRSGPKPDDPSGYIAPHLVFSPEIPGHLAYVNAHSYRDHDIPRGTLVHFEAAECRERENDQGEAFVPYRIVNLKAVPQEHSDESTIKSIEEMRFPPSNVAPTEVAESVNQIYSLALAYEQDKQDIEAEKQRVKVRLNWDEPEDHYLSANFVIKSSALSLKSKQDEPVRVDSSDNRLEGCQATILSFSEFLSPRGESYTRVYLQFSRKSSFEVMKRNLTAYQSMEYFISPGFKRSMPALYEQFFTKKLPEILSLPTSSVKRQIFETILGIRKDHRTPPNVSPEEKLNDLPGFPNFVANKEQIQCIRAFVQENWPLVHIIGPPGTGNTLINTALIQAKQQGEERIRKEHEDQGRIEDLPPKGKYLAAAPSNEAANRLLDNISKMYENGNVGLKPLRIFARCREIPKTATPYTLHYQADQDPGPDFPEMRDLWLKTQDLKSKLRHFYSLKIEERRHLNPKAEQWVKELDEGGAVLQKHVIMEGGHQVYITTMATAGDERLNDQIFTSVFLDECGHAKVADTFLALSRIHGLHGQGTVLCGDDSQLSPTLLSQGPMAEMLKESVPAILRRRNHTHSFHLRKAFRSHPCIMDYINQYIYNNTLEAAVSPEERAKFASLFPFGHKGVPVCLIAVKGGEEQRSVTHSISNQREVEAMELVIKFLLERCGASTEDIGALTFYDSQRKALSEALAKLGLKALNIDACQGNEYEATILSCVRTKESGNIGFLADSGRHCVALSRAKQAMIVIADVEALKKDSGWATFVAWCEQNQAKVNDLDQKLEHYARFSPEDWYRPSSGRLRTLGELSRHCTPLE